MNATRYLIIGGGIAGTTAAETLREIDPDSSICIVSDEPYRLYSRIMLSKPNFFLKKIPFDTIWLKTKEWYESKKIELLDGKNAVKLDSANKIIELNDGNKINYEKLLLAIGGCARPWNVAGNEKQGIFYLRTLNDAKAIISAVKKTKRAVSIGGGFISFEMCEMLRLAGIDVTLVLRESYYWEPLLDKMSGEIIESALQKGGVSIIKNTEASEIVGNESVTGMHLKNGEDISCEMIIAGIGVMCPFEWIRAGGVEVGRGIIANEYLETNVPDIWTAGDSAEFNDLILNEKVQLGNWINAQMQGRTAAFNMAGKHQPFKLVSFYTTQGFGITIAFVGDVRPLPDRIIIARGTPESGSYGRILISKDEIVGATLINRTGELAPITKLIERDVKITGHESELADSQFDLKKLIVL